MKSAITSRTCRARSTRRTTLQARASETEGNAIQVKVELQADCYAGVWAANAKDPQGQPVMEQGDFEEGMRAAEAIGDDTLQKQTQGASCPTASPTAPRRSAWRRSSAATRAAIRTSASSRAGPASCRCWRP